MIYFDGSYLKCRKVDIPLNKIGSRSVNRDFIELPCDAQAPGWYQNAEMWIGFRYHPGPNKITPFLRVRPQNRDYKIPFDVEASDTEIKTLLDSLFSSEDTGLDPQVEETQRAYYADWCKALAG